MNETLEDWRQVMQDRDSETPAGQVLVQSWARSRVAGLDPESESFRLRRVGEGELRQRLDENQALISAARPHLEWTAAALAPLQHVIYMVDAAGVVLLAEGTDREMMRQYGLRPGYDWSETTMGTNGAGTAIAAGRPVAVFGDDHFLRPLRGFVCTASPIRGPGGRVIGAVDLSTTVEEGRPQNLLLAAHVAFSVERELTNLDAPAPVPGASRSRIRRAG